MAPTSEDFIILCLVLPPLFFYFQREEEEREREREREREGEREREREGESGGVREKDSPRLLIYTRKEQFQATSLMFGISLCSCSLNMALKGTKFQTENVILQP